MKDIIHSYAIASGIVLCIAMAVFGVAELIEMLPESDTSLVMKLKAECEEVHQTECEISVYYLPRASVPYDGE